MRRQGAEGFGEMDSGWVQAPDRIDRPPLRPDRARFPVWWCRVPGGIGGGPSSVPHSRQCVRDTSLSRRTNRRLSSAWQRQLFQQDARILRLSLRRRLGAILRSAEPGVVAAVAVLRLASRG